MKRVIRLILLLTLFAIILITYNYFFLKEKQNIQSRTLNFSENNFELNDQKNNLIKNLTYNANINNDDQYTIIAKLSETLDDRGVEFVDMKEVEASYKKKRYTN
jgi:predicted membrane protein